MRVCNEGAFVVSVSTELAHSRRELEENLQSIINDKRLGSEKYIELYFPAARDKVHERPLWALKPMLSLRVLRLHEYRFPIAHYTVG